MGKGVHQEWTGSPRRGQRSPRSAQHPASVCDWCAPSIPLDGQESENQLHRRQLHAQGIVVVIEAWHTGGASQELVPFAFLFKSKWALFTVSWRKCLLRISISKVSLVPPSSDFH